MKLPRLESPDQYRGLYVLDFGDNAAVGYTADEVAVLIESEKYPDAKIYRIHRVLPDGSMELQGVSRERFTVEEGLFFYRSDLGAARDDFRQLEEIAARTPPPCRMKLHLASLESVGGGKADQSPVARDTHITALIYPAEYTHDVSRWLTDAGYQGGDHAEGGTSLVTGYYDMGATLLEKRQLWAAANLSRTAEEVLATTHLPIQRRMAG